MLFASESVVMQNQVFPESRLCDRCNQPFNVPATSTATTCANCFLGAAHAASGPANYVNQIDGSGRPWYLDRLVIRLGFFVVAVIIATVFGFRNQQTDVFSDRQDKRIEEANEMADDACECTDRACATAAVNGFVTWIDAHGHEYVDSYGKDVINTASRRIADCARRFE